MALRNCVSHYGGHNNTYEGCGSDGQNDAYNNCCYSNSGMTVIDVGYTQSKKWCGIVVKDILDIDRPSIILYNREQ